MPDADPRYAHCPACEGDDGCPMCDGEGVIEVTARTEPSQPTAPRADDTELRRRVRALVVDTSPPETDPRVAYLIRHWDIPARQARDMIVGLDAQPGWTRD